MRRLLSSARLLTLVGVGGVGKSRLALRTARHVERLFRDGVWFVELAPLTDEALVPAAAARGLGLRDEPGDVDAALAAHVGTRRLLLVLDNCEHVLGMTAGLIGDLLRACANVVVLATSREPLGVEGEVVFAVPPLALPGEQGLDPRDVAGSEAVALFVERARASAPGFRLTPDNQDAVGRICQSLDGIPLAIEMAAVRLRALGVHQIVRRLEDRLDLPSASDRQRPARQQTLRATMDWSHELLTQPERTLWRRMSVFAGGFTLEAAEAVCAGADLARDDVLGSLVGLVDRSIVGRVETGGRYRYRPLETVRQYGRERLRAVGEEADLLAGHRGWCGEVAAEARAGWWGADQRGVLRRLESEHENLRAALATCVNTSGAATGDAARAGLAICADTWFFWHAQRHLPEGRRWLTDLLALDSEPAQQRARCLVPLGTFLLLLSDPAGAERALDEAVVLAGALHDTATLAMATARLAAVAGARADLGRAGALTDDAVRLARSADDDEVLATVLSLAARVALGRRDVQGAIAIYRECVDLCAAVGEQWLQQRALLPLAMALGDLGDHAEARRMARSALTMADDLDDERMTAWAIEALAWSHAGGGDAEPAARLLGAAEAVRGPDAGHSSYALDRVRTERCRSAAEAALGADGFRRAFERGARLDRRGAVELALERQAEPAGARAPAAGVKWPLSAREAEIATLVADGLSNRAIADRLFISVRTAENHVSHVLVKLGLRSRAQLASWVAANRPGGGPPVRSA